MIEQLTRDDRLCLMRFVCCFVWADLHVNDAERAYVADLVLELGLDQRDARLVSQWLSVPPPVDDVDPNRIPRQHRDLFLHTLLGVVTSDGRLSPIEVENYSLLSTLVHAPGA